MEKYQARPQDYRGTWMRSTTETRFARWLESRDYRWVYEPETFVDRSSGTQYTPDFYVPDLDAFFEVKGTPQWETEPAVDRLIERQYKTFAAVCPIQTGRCEGVDFGVFLLYSPICPCVPAFKASGKEAIFQWVWTVRPEINVLKLPYPHSGWRFVVGPGCPWLLKLNAPCPCADL